MVNHFTEMVMKLPLGVSQMVNHFTEMAVNDGLFRYKLFGFIPLCLSWSVLGMSSFYTELNRGLGASQRLWQLMERVPSIPVSLSGRWCVCL